MYERERAAVAFFFSQTIGRQGTAAAAAAKRTTNNQSTCANKRARVCVCTSVCLCVRFMRVPWVEGRQRRCAVCLPADDRRPRVEGVYHVTIEVPPPPPLLVLWCVGARGGALVGRGARLPVKR